MDINAYNRSHVERALSGDYQRHGDPADADCVVAAAFGYRQDGTPGRSNEQLASFIATRFPALPKILQFEIADALGDPKAIRISAPAEAARLDTPDLIAQAKTVMDQHGWRTAIVVAHPHHVPWVDFLSQQAGIETITPDGLQVVGFEPESAQYWTRNKEAWQKEVRLRHDAGNPREIQE